MKIIDAHHHIWCPYTDPLNIDYVWLKKTGSPKPFGDPSAIQKDYLMSDFLSESRKYDVCASVHIQVDGAIKDPLKEALWVQQVAELSSQELAHIGFADLAKKDPELLLGQYAELKLVRGVRHIIARLNCPQKQHLNFTQEDYLSHSVWTDNFASLSDYHLSFDLQLYPEQMYEAAKFLKQFPQQRVVIDHAGSPYDQTQSGREMWATSLKYLAKLPNLFIKLSGFGMYNHAWSAESVQFIFNEIIKQFGVERVMFGSNYPVDKLFKEYDDIVDELMICAHTLKLKSNEVEQLFYRNAKSFYSL